MATGRIKKKIQFLIKRGGVMEELKIDESYDNELKEIEFYKNSETHQFMLPYVGSNYEEYRVLLVAESHYLGNEEDRKKVVDL